MDDMAFEATQVEHRALDLSIDDGQQFPINRLPNILYMKIESTYLKEGNYEIGVTLTFNEHIEDRLDIYEDYKLTIGSFKIGNYARFGIKGGILQFKLSNCLLQRHPDENTFTKYFKIARSKTHQDSVNTKSGRSSGASSGITNKKLNFTGEHKVSHSKETGIVLGSSDQIETPIYQFQITSQGGPENPSWVFKSQLSDESGNSKNFEESLIDKTFCVLLKKCDPAKLDAFFKVKHEHIVVKLLEGFGGKNITNNKISALIIVSPT